MIKRFYFKQFRFFFIRSENSKLFSDAKKIYGCSAGSMLAACLIGGMCMSDVCEYVLDVVKDAKSRFLGKATEISVTPFSLLY